MQQQDIHSFLTNYFKANDCSIIERTDNSLTVQLTVELDKQLMNRPFYWHFVESTGQKPEPMKLSLFTNFDKKEEAENSELITFGSPRLHQIFQSTRELGSFIRLYENCNVTDQTPLYPWLALNLKVSYICDLKKNKFYSLGLQLINGQIKTDFHNCLHNLSLTPKIPHYCFTMSPLIMPKSGLRRLENYMHTIINEEDFTWADEAIKRWHNDLQLLESFYNEESEKSESYYNEIKALQKQYEPKIIVTIVNGGLFYLSTSQL